jgi:hypothetical protein
MTIRKPSWFSDQTVMVSTAPTCGHTKGGRLLPIVDPATGKRIQIQDPETGGYLDALNDQLLADAKALVEGRSTETLSFIPKSEVSLRCAVPVYFDRRYAEKFKAAMQEPAYQGFTTSSIGALVNDNLLTIRGGHGSLSQDQRIGDVPYIKVSDLRAGLVNINPTNRIPHSVAQMFWRGYSSDLRPFDLVCPERTSKNIGDFCVLMPGQEQVVMTKEVIIFRPGPNAHFDPFYLLWALTLKVVRDHWRRVVFMQTNREDVGKRYLEIEIPIAPNAACATEVSGAFRLYYQTIATARKELVDYLNADHAHHFFVSGAEELHHDATAASLVDDAATCGDDETEGT